MAVFTNSTIFIGMKGIYKITNPKGKVYIGESVDVERRWAQYKNGHYSRQWKLGNSIKKYGWEAHKVELIEECTTEALSARERYWQLHYKAVDAGLNLKLTGDSVSKTYDSEEVRKNKSLGQMGRKHTEETKRKLSEMRKGVPKPKGFGDQIRDRFLGTKLTEEHKLKIIQSKQKPCSVDGVVYDSCKSAAAAIGIPATTLANRLKSKNYPKCFYIG